MDFPKKQAQRLMPLYLLEYSEKLFENHPNPEDPWDGGSDYTAGYGIDITNDEISVDTEVIATKSDISSMVTTTMLDDALDDYALKTDIPENVSDLYNDAGYITSNALNGYIKDNDINYSAIFRGQYVMVKTSGAYTTTTYGDGTIGRTLPYGLPGYTYSLPDKNGTFAMVEDIPSLSGYATESWVNNQGFISSTDLSNYVTSSELSNQLSNYALSSTVTNLASQVTTLESLVSNHTTQINSINSNITDLQTLTSTHTSQISGINSSVTSLESLVNTNISSISTIQNNLNSLGSQVTTLEGLVSTNTSNISALQSSVSNCVTLSQLSSTLSDYTPTSGLASVATTGDYNDLINKPNLVNPHTIASGDLVFQATGTWYPAYKWFDDAVVTSASSSFVDIITNFEADLILPEEFTRDGVLYAKRMVDGVQVDEHEFRYVYAIYSADGEPGYIWFIYNDSLDTITSVTKQRFDAVSYSTLTNILSNYVTSSSLSSTLSNYALKSEVPTYSLTTTSTPVLSSATLSQSYETLTFTYSDNTTASFNFLTTGTSLSTSTVNVLDSASLTSN